MKIFLFILLCLFSCENQKEATESKMGKASFFKASKIDWNNLGQEISIQEAAAYTSNFSWDPKVMPISYLSKEKLLKAMNAPNFKGFCFMVGSNKSDGTPDVYNHLVVIPVDSNGIKLDGVNALERAGVCPPDCP